MDRCLKDAVNKERKEEYDDGNLNTFGNELRAQSMGNCLSSHETIFHTSGGAAVHKRRGSNHVTSKLPASLKRMLKKSRRICRAFKKARCLASFGC